MPFVFKKNGNGIGVRWLLPHQAILVISPSFARLSKYLPTDTPSSPVEIYPAKLGKSHKGAHVVRLRFLIFNFLGRSSWKFAHAFAVMHRRQFHKKISEWAFSGLPVVWKSRDSYYCSTASNSAFELQSSLYRTNEEIVACTREAWMNAHFSCNKLVIETMAGGRRAGGTEMSRRNNSETAKYRYIAAIGLPWCQSYSRLCTI